MAEDPTKEELEEEPKEEPRTDAQIVEEFKKEKSRYEKATTEIRSEYQDIYNAYMGDMDEVVSTPYDTKQSIPKLRTEIAYVKPFIFSGDPEIQIDGVGDEDKDIAGLLEKIVNYRLKQSIPNALDKIEDWVHQAVTFGTSVLRVIWRFETQKKEDGTEVPTVDMPDLDVLNIMDVYYNPMIPQIDRQTSLIFRYVLTLDEVKANPAYNYQDELGARNVDKLKPKANFKSDDKNSTQQLSSDVLSNQEGMVEVFERVTPERIQTFAEGDEMLILRDVENPDGYIQAVKLLFEKNTIPNVFNGMGVGQNTLGLGEAYYKMFNQTLQNVKMSNNPMAIYAKGTRIDKRQLVSKPGGGVEIDAMGKNLSDVFQWSRIPDVQQGALDILNRIDDEHKRASGANDLVQGSASNDTLGQDEIAQANISNRFELISRRFKNSLVEVAEMLLDMELQNLQSPESDILRIFPPELRGQIFLVLKQQAQNVKYDISIKGETTIAKNKQLESKRLVDLFDLSQNFLTDQEKRAFVRRIAEKQGEQNIDEIIGETNPMMMMQEMGQMPQGQYNQAGAVATQQGLNRQL